MKLTPRTAQDLAREAFGLLLELRDRDDAHLLLTKAITFLEMKCWGGRRTPIPPPSCFPFA
jgi:hypothetical protein